MNIPALFLRYMYMLAIFRADFSSFQNGESDSFAVSKFVRKLHLFESDNVQFLMSSRSWKNS